MQEQSLIEKIKRLPPERIVEVEDFVDFLLSREIERQLVQATSRLSGKALSDVWDNPLDAAYDEP